MNSVLLVAKGRKSFLVLSPGLSRRVHKYYSDYACVYFARLGKQTRDRLNPVKPSPGLLKRWQKVRSWISRARSERISAR